MREVGEDIVERNWWVGWLVGWRGLCGVGYTVRWYCGSGVVSVSFGGVIVVDKAGFLVGWMVWAM